MRLKRPTLLALAFASGKDPFALYKDPKAYAALMDDVGKKLAACKANLKFFWDNKDQLLNGVRTGEIVGAMMWDTGGWKLNSENPDIQYIAPKSGALGWIDTFALPAKGRNDAAAYAWINFNMRPEIAAKVAASAGNFTASKGADQLMDAEAQGAVREELPRGGDDATSSGIRRCRPASRTSRARCSTASRRRTDAPDRAAADAPLFPRIAHPPRAGDRRAAPMPQDLEVDRVTKRYGATRGGRRAVARRRARQLLFDPRAVRLRQDHAAADDRRLHRARRRRHPHRRRGRCAACRPTGARSTWCSSTSRCFR